MKLTWTCSWQLELQKHHRDQKSQLCRCLCTHPIFEQYHLLTLSQSCWSCYSDASTMSRLHCAPSLLPHCTLRPALQLLIYH